MNEEIEELNEKIFDLESDLSEIESEFLNIRKIIEKLVELNKSANDNDKEIELANTNLFYIEEIKKMIDEIKF